MSVSMAGIFFKWEWVDWKFCFWVFFCEDAKHLPPLNPLPRARPCNVSSNTPAFSFHKIKFPNSKKQKKLRPKSQRPQLHNTLSKKIQRQAKLQLFIQTKKVFLHNAFIFTNMRPLFSYYGGKQKIVGKILPLIPEHKIYAEPFAGGATVFWAKQKSQMEVLNDINQEIFNFYFVVKTKYHELKSMLDWTLHSRYLYIKARNIYQQKERHTDVERAWAWWILTNCSFANKFNGGWAYERVVKKSPVTIKNKIKLYNSQKNPRKNTKRLPRMRRRPQNNQKIRRQRHIFLYRPTLRQHTSSTIQRIRRKKPYRTTRLVACW